MVPILKIVIRNQNAVAASLLHPHIKATSCHFNGTVTCFFPIFMLHTDIIYSVVIINSRDLIL